VVRPNWIHSARAAPEISMVNSRRYCEVLEKRVGLFMAVVLGSA